MAALTPRRALGVAAVIALLTITYGAVSTVQAIAWETGSEGPCSGSVSSRRSP